MNGRKNQGITLIALVITVIILIILAGVTISLLVGDNGIINKAKQGKVNMQNAQAEENKALESLFAQTEGIDLSKFYLGIKKNGQVADNVFFVVSDVEGPDSGDYLSNLVQLCVGELDNETGTKVLNITNFNEKATTGYLSDSHGYPLKGWTIIIDEVPQVGTVSSISIDQEIEGKVRLGTRIDTEGKIYATYNDNTEKVIAQIPIVNFGWNLSIWEQWKVGPNLYRQPTGSDQSYDGVGERVNGTYAGTMERLQSVEDIKKVLED